MGIRLHTLGIPGAWSPYTLPILLDLDAADPSTLYQDSAMTTAAAADADPVGGWKDKSGRGNHHTQATSGKRASLKLGIQAGKPVVRFDGVDDVLMCAAFTPATRAELTLFMVATMRANAGNYCAFASGRHTGDDVSDGFNIDQGNASSASFNSLNIESAKQGSEVDLYPGSEAFGIFHIHEFRIWTPAQSYYQDGASQGSRGSSGNTMDMTQFRIGARFFGAEFGYSALDVARVLAFDGELSAPQSAAVVSYIKARWSTP